MQLKLLVTGAAFACALLFSSGRALAVGREMELDFSLDIRWMRSDGAGGVFLRNGDELIRFDSAGRVEHLPLPRPSTQGASPLSGYFFSGSTGELWAWGGNTRLLRYTRARGWEEAVASLPGEGDYECRIEAQDPPRLLCSVTDSTDQIVDALAATIAWPALSPWEKADLPVSGSRILPASLWAMSLGNGDTLGLFLASGNTRNWRRTVFTMRSFSDSTPNGVALPFPHHWAGPGVRNSLEHSDRGRAARGDKPLGSPTAFAKERAALVSQPDREWIALGELLIMRKDATWTFFYAKDQNIYSSLRAGDPNEKASSLSYKLTRSVPYLYTTFLAVSAIQSGPGWEGETAWAVGGIVPGALVGGFLTLLRIGHCMTPNAGCGSEEGILLPVITVPLALGIWAVGSHQTAERADRTWMRVGAAALGAVSGAGLYYAFPDETAWMYFGGLAGASLGMVAGYRLAWFE